MKSSGKYYCEPNDKVMAAEKGHVYPAKVLRVHTVNNIRKYFIHYDGWPRKYDVWVDDKLLSFEKDTERLAKLEAGLQGQVAKEGGAKEDSGAKGDKGKGKKGSQSKAMPAPGVSSPSQVSPRRGAQPGASESASAESENVACAEADEPMIATVKQGSKRVMTAEAMDRVKKHNKRMIAMDLNDEGGDDHPKLVIPFPLKKHLVDEWGLIVADVPRLLPLPRPAGSTVDSIIGEFLAAKLPKVEETERPQYQEMFQALQREFDVALPSILLYGQERRQYDALAAQMPDLLPHQVYGAEHLLRLFVKLPRQVANVYLPKEEVDKILVKLTDLLKFINLTPRKYLDLSKYVESQEVLAALSPKQEETSAMVEGAAAEEAVPTEAVPIAEAVQTA
ncbi:MRG-domain-containing protein [Ochromonadaceae sp. CCMP2298]|nr:MRG-domain-containing protein [Ochromonadaceae sp. CCMP2298]|mmetsp:Transcript_11279/g.24648  ORF Transcript_11279/g.24648 Transcript_11279/m.24648 type:complete len:392 (+) Transcript_11279:162-1337(+)